MYTYVAGASVLDASMPTWVQAGGFDKWSERLKDPEIRARVKEEMAANAQDWENLGYFAGPDGMVFLEFKNKKHMKYLGKTLAEVAAERGQYPRDAIIDLVIEDGSRVATAYYLMSEESLKKADPPTLDDVRLRCHGAGCRRQDAGKWRSSPYLRQDSRFTRQICPRRESHTHGRGHPNSLDVQPAVLALRETG